MHFDSTGKISLDHIYVQPDPRAYFCTLRKLDYCIPQLAKPYFLKMIHAYRETSHAVAATVLDIGCSYGINAVLLRCGATMEELYQRYCSEDAHRQPRAALLGRDRELVRDRNCMKHTRFIGLDSSEPALTYARAAGFLDDAVHADLEAAQPTEGQRAQLANADIVISTGCMGYVTDRTIARLLTEQSARKPWMAHFVLRMFSLQPLSDTLTDFGYETVQVPRVFKQRRFSSPQEQAQILDTMASVGVDPSGLEAEGWLYATLVVSRPRDKVVPAAFAALGRR